MRRADIEVPNSPVAVSARGLLACYPRGSFYPLSTAVPSPTAGSLGPTFVSARAVALAVKLPCALTLAVRFPTALREPLNTSVTFWEVTAPVKLPTRYCPVTRLGLRLESRDIEGGIPRLPPPGPEPRLRRLPPILCTRSQNPIPGCSKAPRGLSVLSRVASIFAGATISPSPSPRQRPSRYAFRAGRNLPD